MSSPEVERDRVPQHWATIVLKPRVDSFNQAERTKRHFEAYGSLDHIRIVRTEADLDKKYERPASGRFITKAKSPEAS